MRSLTSQKELREARDPGFCYLCGEEWRESDRGPNKPDRDHVPPQGIFGEEHRSPPLVLLTHPRCNNAQSEYDESIGQLLSLVRKIRPTARDVSKLRLSLQQGEGMVPSGAVEYFPLRKIIVRWIRAFHAALYREFLPREVEIQVHEPLPGGDRPGEDTTLHPMRPRLAGTIRENRAARTAGTNIPSGIPFFDPEAAALRAWTNQVPETTVVT